MAISRVLGFCVIVVFQNTVVFSDAHFVPHNLQLAPEQPLPFPPCRADDIECLRRGIRTFFILMDSSYLGMMPVDPVILNSIGVALPEQHMTFLLRRVNVTGTRWSKLVERRFNIEGRKSGVILLSDMHVTAQIIMDVAGSPEPNIADITIDIQGAETNITYPWVVHRGINNEDYILIGLERIVVRNMRTPTYFLQPNNQHSRNIGEILDLKHSILDQLSNEIIAAVMHSVVDNFRLFSANVPVRKYYQYN